MPRTFLLLMTISLAFGGTRINANAQAPNARPGGQLQIIGDGGKLLGACPLKQTDVSADVAGFVGRVTVQQIFHNPTERKIEAVYVFPLPQDAAVDSMVMTVGDRRVEAKAFGSA